MTAGGYAVGEILGRGGMGTVYKARSPEGRIVALKEMVHPGQDPASRARAVEQFRHEAAILKTLRHPGVVQVYETFEDQDRHYLVMEFIDGFDLEYVIRRRRDVITPELVSSWIRQLCAVLHFLHTLEPPVIVRDLKPSNIMVSRQGQLRLIDFGIARLFTESDKTQTFIRGMGSEGYAPLEQYGRGGTDPRSDIYALGATIYAMLTLQAPPSAVELVTGDATLTSVRSLNPQVPRHQEAALARMMALKREHRFSTVAEAYKAFLGERPAELDEDATGELESRATGELEAMQTMRPHPCLIWKRIGEQPPGLGSPQALVEEVADGSHLPYSLCLGLGTRKPTSVELWVGDQRHTIESVDLPFRRAQVFVASDTLGPHIGRDRVLPLVRGELIRLAELLLEKLDSLPAVHQEEALDVLAELARVYRGDAAREEPILRTVQAGRERLRLADDAEVLARLAELARLARRDDPDLAERAARALEELAGKKPDQASRLLFRAAELRGDLAPFQRRFPDFVGFLERERPLRQGDPAGEAFVLLHLAQETGNAETARRALSSLEAVTGPDHPLLAPYLKLLGELTSGTEATEFKTRAMILKYRK